MLHFVLQIITIIVFLKMHFVQCMRQSKHWHLLGLFHTIIRPCLQFNTASSAATSDRHSLRFLLSDLLFTVLNFLWLLSTFIRVAMLRIIKIYCYTSQLKYVFQLEESMACVMGQNSLTPKGNNNLSFQLACEQVVHIETAAKFFTRD